MDRLAELIEKDLIKVKEETNKYSDDENHVLHCLTVELLLDIREELRQIKRSQGDSKWSSKL